MRRALAHQRARLSSRLGAGADRRSRRSGRRWRAPSGVAAGSARRRARGSRRTGRARRSPRARSPSAPSSATCSRELGVADGRGDARAGRARRAGSPRCRRRRRRRARAGARRRRRPACVKSASCAVVKTSGDAAGRRPVEASGTGISIRSWTTASSAWPPPPTIAITRSPSCEARRARAARDDLAGELEPGDVLRRAGRRRIEAAPLHHVGAVEPGRPHAHEAPRRPRARGRGAPRRSAWCRGSWPRACGPEPYTDVELSRSSTATHSMCGVCGNMSTGRTRASS